MHMMQFEVYFAVLISSDVMWAKVQQQLHKLHNLCHCLLFTATSMKMVTSHDRTVLSS